MPIEIDVQYHDAVRELDALLKRTTDLRPALELLVDVAKRGFDDQYSTGKGWGALKKSTVAEKGNNRKLIDRGDLRRAFTQHPKVSFTKYAVDVGVSIVEHPEVKYLKSGARGMKKRNPAKIDRKITQQRGAEVLLGHFLAGGFSGAGL